MAEFDIEKLRATFADIDKDKSGTVDEVELTSLLKKHAENVQRAADISKVTGFVSCFTFIFFNYLDNERKSSETFLCHRPKVF